MNFEKCTKIAKEYLNARWDMELEQCIRILRNDNRLNSKESYLIEFILREGSI